MTHAVLASLAPIILSLAGYGVVRVCRPPWPWLAQWGAGMVLGPPLLSFVAFFLFEYVTGFTTLAARGFAAVAVLGFVASLRLRGPGPVPAGRWVSATAITGAVWLAITHGVTMLNRPLPRGDGFSNFATKARFFLTEGSVWPFLHDPQAVALHVDYPLHMPMLMSMGSLIADSDLGLFMLSPGWLILPGFVLFASSMAGLSGRAAGVTAALVAALSPGFQFLSASGYAEPHLGALLCVAAVAVFGPRPNVGFGAIAAGLMVWIKLEGAVLLLGLLSALAVHRHLSRRQFWVWTLLSLGTGAVWPLIAWAQGLGLQVAENRASGALFSRVWCVVRSFGQRILDWDGEYRFIWVPILVATWCAVRERSTSGARVGTAFAACALGLLAINVLRNTRPEVQTGVAQRLLYELLPLGIFLLALLLKHESGMASGHRRRDHAESLRAP